MREIQGFDKDGSKKPVKSRLCGQQQAMRQLKLNKFTEQGYRFHQWYPFSVAPHGRHRYKNLWRFCYENVTLKRAQNTSHLSAGRLRYEIAHSGRAWYGIRFPPKWFQSFKVTVYLSVTVKGIVVVRTKVMESSLVFKNVVYSDQQRPQKILCKRRDMTV